MVFYGVCTREFKQKLRTFRVENDVCSPQMLSNLKDKESYELVKLEKIIQVFYRQT